MMMKKVTLLSVMLLLVAVAAIFPALASDEFDGEFWSPFKEAVDVARHPHSFDREAQSANHNGAAAPSSYEDPGLGENSAVVCASEQQQLASAGDDQDPQGFVQYGSESSSSVDADDVGFSGNYPSESAPSSPEAECDQPVDRSSAVPIR
jgi:hypothetical protein